MRENRQYASEGGGEWNPFPTPILLIAFQNEGLPFGASRVATSTICVYAIAITPTGREIFLGPRCEIRNLTAVGYLEIWVGLPLARFDFTTAAFPD